MLDGLLKKSGVSFENKRLFVHILPVGIKEPLVTGGGAESAVRALFGENVEAVLASLGVAPADRAAFGHVLARVHVFDVPPEPLALQLLPEMEPD